MRQIKGILISGKGEGAFFTGLDWVKKECRRKLGFEPYPGTFNLRASEADISAIKAAAREEGIDFLPPTKEFCQAVCVRARIGGIKGAVILPHVDDYYKNIIEIVAPIKVKDKLGLTDGDEVIVTLDRHLVHFMQKVKGVIFDLDGTLIDSVGTYFSVLKETWRRVGLPLPERQKVVEIMVKGQPFWQSWSELVPTELEDEKAVKKRCMEVTEQVWDELFGSQTKLIPGAEETLITLKQAGFAIGMVTSSWFASSDTDQVFQVFRAVGIEPEELFSAIVSRFDIPRMKPSPDCVVLCAEKLGIATTDCLYVGDSPADIKAGKAAGAVTVGVLSGVGSYQALAKEVPDMILQSVAQLDQLARLVM